MYTNPRIWWQNLQMVANGCRNWHWSRFYFSRVRVAFSGLLAFTFGFSWWFFSGLKNHEKRFKMFHRKSIFKSRSKNFRKNSKILKNQDFRKIFEKSRKIRFFQFKSSYENFRIFRFPEKFENFSISISKSIFDQKISIRFHVFFLNRYRIIRRIQTWRLEVPGTQRGRVKHRNVTLGKQCNFCTPNVNSATTHIHHYFEKLYIHIHVT